MESSSNYSEVLGFMKEKLDQITEEISISKCFGARLSKGGVKF